MMRWTRRTILWIFLSRRISRATTLTGTSSVQRERTPKAAGVDELIHFQQRPVSGLSHPKKYGFLITNPPYGERIEEKKNLPELYKTIGERFAALDSWSAYIITAYEDTERYFGRKADKNRKIYNGMMKTYFYQFLGPKPPARKREARKEEQ